MVEFFALLVLIAFGVIVAIARYVVPALLLGWVIMLVQGGLSSAFEWQTWSYGTSILIGLAMSIVGNVVFANKR